MVTKHRNRKFSGFTLVELIVVITILVVLGTIAFISLGWYAGNARDGSRVSDIANISKSLDVVYARTSTYPKPDHSFSVTYSWGALWTQGTIGSSVVNILGSAGAKISKAPVDPLLTTKEYVYSLVADGKAYQVKSDWEGENIVYKTTRNNFWIDQAQAATGNPAITYINGNYGWLAIKTQTGGTTCILAVPSIITSTGSEGQTIEVSTNTLSGKLLFNGKSSTAASLFNPNKPVYCNASLPGDTTAVNTMMGNLKTAYSGSDIAQLPAIQSLLMTSGTPLTDLGSSLVNKLGGTVVATTSTGYPGCDTADITLANGQVWAACNVGATTAYAGQSIATGAPSAAQQLFTWYFYQWGRNKDVTTGAATMGPVAIDSTNDFILNSGDWLMTPNNNLWGWAGGSPNHTFATATSGDKILMKGVCATGYHIPTDWEWADTRSTLSNNWNTIISTLKLPLAGYRRGDTAGYTNMGTVACYHSATPDGTGGKLNSLSADMCSNSSLDGRAPALSVRCLKD